MIQAINLTEDVDDECGDSDKYPQGPYSDGGGEADSPRHCDHCSVFLENPLTEDGNAYVKARAWNVCNATSRAWREFYGYLFLGED